MEYRTFGRAGRNVDVVESGKYRVDMAALHGEFVVAQ